MTCPPRRPRPGAPRAPRAHPTLYSLCTSHSARRALPLAWLLALVLLPGAARAATFTIANDDVTALTNAITTANGNGQADTINLVTGGTYTFTTGNGGGDTALPSVNNDPSGPDLTLNGNGATIARSSAGGTPNFRLLVVSSGATVSVSGVTFSNGLLGDNGAGLYNNGGTLTLTNCTLSNNSAVGSGNGGGIYANGGTLTLNNCTLSQNSASGGSGGGGGVFNVAGGTLTVQNSTLSQNSAFLGGGILNGDNGTVTVQNSTLSQNSAQYGGGIYNNGTMTVQNSTLSQNSASGSGGGGGIYNEGNGTLTVQNSTLSQNSAFNGGGIYNQGTLTVQNSTLSQNSAQYGGGIYNRGTVTVQNSTLSQNSAAQGGGIYNEGGTMTVQNSILAFNPAANGPDLKNASGSINGDYNLIRDTAGWGSFTSGGTHNITGQDPKFDPAGLQDNGGPTKTIKLLSGSPAIEAGSDALLPDDTLDMDGDSDTTEDIPFDQRGTGFPRVVGALVDIGACEVQTSTPQTGPSYVVSATSDQDDGACTVEHCTLREAIKAANAHAGDDTITFANGLSGSITLTTALPNLSDNVTISGPGASALTVQSATTGALELFSVNAGVNVTLSGLTISKGNGGIASSGTLSVTHCTLSGNTTGILNYSGMVTLTNCTLSGNINGINNQAGATVNATNCTISGTGSGISNLGTANATNCTLSGNAIGINNFGTVTATNCTVNGNTNYGIYNNTGGTLTIKNTICAGNLHDLGGDLVTKEGKNLTSGDPMLGALADNGGPTQTMRPLPGSPAIDQGKDSAPLTTDQRGRVRPFDDTTVTNVVGGDGSDIGAYEDDGGQLGNAFVVNSTADTDDLACTASDCTLREAINLANAQGGADTISFAGSVTPTITLTSALPNLSTDMTIQGPGASVLTVNAQQVSRIFLVSNGTASGPTVTLSGLSLTNGRAKASDPEDRGGAIFNDRSTLTVMACTLSSNSAIFGGGIFNDGTLTVPNSTLSQNSAFYGGGIWNFGTVTVQNSTLSQNSADAGGGGGIDNEGTGTLTVQNSTLSQNSAGSGGGIYNEGNGTLTVQNSTLSSNSAGGGGGGGIFNVGTLTVQNSILAFGAGGSGPDLNNGGTLNGDYNLIGSTDGWSAFGSHNITGQDPKFDPLGLQNNGGPTQTIKLLSGSPALDAGKNFTSLLTDQRGQTRPLDIAFIANASGGDGSDIGAVEMQLTDLQSGDTLVVTVTNDNDDTCTFGDCSLREAITLANTTPNGATPDTIRFALASAAPFTIGPTSALPDVTEAVVIDGTTQPGYSDHPLVQLNGTNAGATANGLKLLGSGSTVRGLAIGNFVQNGVFLAGSGGHRVESCYLGTFYNGLVVTAQTSAPNNNGVLIFDSSNNVVGLDKNGSGAGNRIWNNNAGVIVNLTSTAQGNTLRGNTLRQQFINIDLGNDLVTPNDAGDGDTGANDLQNFPVLTSAVQGFNKTHTLLTGTLNSKASRSYRLDFYRSSTTSGVSQPFWAGTFYLGSLLVTTNGSGNLAGPFSFDAGVAVSGVHYIATATDTVTGDTSECSAPLLQDGVRPAISLSAPNPAGGVLTVAANFPQIGGTATDNNPGVTVRLQLLRLSDGMWWDGTIQNWVPTQTAQTILPTTTPGAAPGNWNSTGNLPKPSNSTLRDDKYQIVAYAIDVAGNQLVASKTLSYDLHLPTVSISTPGSGAAHNSAVNALNLASVSGTSVHPLVGMKKVLLKLVRSSDSAWWNGSAWVPSSSPAQYLATSLNDPVGSSPAAWSKSSGLPAVGASLTNQVQVGKVYNLSAVSYDRLNQASAAFLLRVKIVSSHSVFKLPSVSRSAAPRADSPSE